MTISADEGSRRVTLDVAGKCAELTVVNARAIILKLREALRYAEQR